MAISVERVGGGEGVSEGAVVSVISGTAGLGVDGAGVSGVGELQARRIRQARIRMMGRRNREEFMEKIPGEKSAGFAG